MITFLTVLIYVSYIYPVYIYHLYIVLIYRTISIVYYLTIRFFYVMLASASSSQSHLIAQSFLSLINELPYSYISHVYIVYIYPVYIYLYIMDITV
jgi:hypothetical protein